MNAIIGNGFLSLCIICSLLTLVIPNKRFKNICFILSSLCPALSFIILLIAFITHDFSLHNVFFNSSSQLPLKYLIAAGWASHEGSFLLWFALLGLSSLAYYAYLNAAQFEDAIKVQYSINSPLYCFIASFILYDSSPFTAFAYRPAEGLGLNPMLQDAAIAIHPPILYLGNLCTWPIFLGAITLLQSKQQNPLILRIMQQFTALALMFLTIGITLGAWWAYRELGWGGYWFFDPVENISILPWLLCISLYHLYIIERTSNAGDNVKAICILGLLAFLSVCYGTFIVRSGIISSVHSFSFAPERGLWLFVMASTLSLIAFYCYYSANISPFSPQHHPPKQRAIIRQIFQMMNLFWLVPFIILVIALLYPIYCYLIYEAEISIDPEYFYQIFIPSIAPLILFAAIMPYSYRALKHHTILVASLIIAVAMLLAIWYFMNFKLLTISGVMLFSSLTLCIYTLNYWRIISDNFKNAISIQRLSMILGHLSFGMLALFITLNIHYAKSINFAGTKNASIKSGDWLVTLEDIKFAKHDNYLRQIVQFRIEDIKHNKVTILYPENRFYEIEKSLSQEVDIFSYLFHDIYAAIERIDEKTIYAKIYYQPFISFIWLSSAIMALAFLLSWTHNKMRKL